MLDGVKCKFGLERVTLGAKAKGPGRRLVRSLARLLNPIARERVAMMVRHQYWPRIRNPRTFSEKIAHRKHYSSNKAYVTCADKYALRAYVSERVGESNLPILYDVFFSFDDADTSSWPESFVLKRNCDSGSTIIVKNKSLITLSELSATGSEKLRWTFWTNCQALTIYETADSHYHSYNIRGFSSPIREALPWNWVASGRYGKWRFYIGNCKTIIQHSI